MIQQRQKAVSSEAMGTTDGGTMKDCYVSSVQRINLTVGKPNSISEGLEELVGRDVAKILIYTTIELHKLAVCENHYEYYDMEDSFREEGMIVTKRNRTFMPFDDMRRLEILTHGRIVTTLDRISYTTAVLREANIDWRANQQIQVEADWMGRLHEGTNYKRKKRYKAKVQAIEKERRAKGRTELTVLELKRQNATVCATAKAARVVTMARKAKSRAASHLKELYQQTLASGKGKENQGEPLSKRDSKCE
jgi:hypothetical protein